MHGQEAVKPFIFAEAAVTYWRKGGRECDMVVVFALLIVYEHMETETLHNPITSSRCLCAKELTYIYI